MSTIQKFTDLYVWQKARELVVEIYQVTKTFPRDERFGLTMQIRRAVISIIANIAEGFKRQTKLDQRHFYNIAASSLEELRAEIILSQDLQYLSDHKTDDILHLIDFVAILIHKWKNYL